MANTKGRIVSLDVFRGITIALMILVNYAANPSSYVLLNHAAWNGCTLADLVFPFFLFIVGVACTVSNNNAENHAICESRGSSGKSIYKILSRTLKLFLLGLFLNAFPNNFSLISIRYLGVLQRIAICYCFSALCCLKLSIKMQILIFIVLVSFYAFLLSLYPYTLDLSVIGIVDRWLLAPQHLYAGYAGRFEPEGIISTGSAIATTMLGNVTGYFLLSTYFKTHKTSILVFTGCLFIIIGYVWSLWIPINKALWTSSYVIFTGGISLVLLAACYFLIEIKQYTFWILPFKVFSANAILVYVLHMMVLKLQITTLLHHQNGIVENVRQFIIQHFFAWTSAANGYLLYAILSVMFWFGIMNIFYSKGIMTKI